LYINPSATSGPVTVGTLRASNTLGDVLFTNTFGDLSVTITGDVALHEVSFRSFATYTLNVTLKGVIDPNTFVFLRNMVQVLAYPNSVMTLIGLTLPSDTHVTLPRDVSLVVGTVYNNGGAPSLPVSLTMSGYATRALCVRVCVSVCSAARLLGC
jgi:hypothetical protein